MYIFSQLNSVKVLTPTAAMVGMELLALSAPLGKLDTITQQAQIAKATLI